MKSRISKHFNLKKKKYQGVMVLFFFLVGSGIVFFFLESFFFSFSHPSFSSSNTSLQLSFFQNQSVSSSLLSFTRVLATIPNLQLLKPRYPKTYLFYSLPILSQKSTNAASFLEDQLMIHYQTIFPHSEFSLPEEGLFLSNIAVYQPSRTIYVNTTELENPLVYQYLFPLLNQTGDVFLLQVNWQRRLIKAYSVINYSQSINASFFKQRLPDEPLMRLLIAFYLPSHHPPLASSLAAFQEHYGNLTLVEAWEHEHWLYFKVDFPSVLFPKIFRDQGGLR